ncbi:MAG: CopG family ribbon-helix-helix protein [Acidobacteriota bacterium]
MATKVTFTLDDETVARLHRAAERLGKPKSQVVREAVADYSERIGRLSERERLDLLKSFDEVVQAIPRNSLIAVQRELRQIKAARRAGGRRPLRSDR